MESKRYLFLAFALLVLALSGVEIASEVAAGEPFSDMGDDLAMFAVSALVVALYALDSRRREREIVALRAQLSSARGQLLEVDAQSRRIAGEYRAVVQKQFDAWQLTASEQDVVLALLKGLSFREIAALRETREKTVRQHAANVYRKAGVAGRHELAAWFFEDLLGPGEPVASEPGPRRRSVA